MVPKRVNVKVKGTIHWVSIQYAKEAEVRVYDRLFTHEMPDGNKEVDFKEYINLTLCKL